MNIKLIGNGNIISSGFYSSFLINDNILVDTPPGVTKELNKINISLDDIDIMVITHLHGDHFFDLPFIILNEYSRKRKKKLFIIGPKDLKKELNKLMKLAFKYPLSKYLDILDVEFKDALTIQSHDIGNELYLSSIKMEHGIKDSYGYILKKYDKALGITGDTRMCPGLTYMLKRVNTCLIDLNNRGKHLTLEDLNKLTKKYKVNYIPVHYTENIVKELQIIPNVKIINAGENFYI